MCKTFNVTYKNKSREISDAQKIGEKINPYNKVQCQFMYLNHFEAYTHSIYNTNNCSHAIAIVGITVIMTAILHTDPITEGSL